MIKTSLVLLALVAYISCSQSDNKFSHAKPPNATLSDSLTLPKTINEHTVSKLIAKFPKLSGYKIHIKNPSFAIKGDFYGDQAEDVAVLLTQKGIVSICILNLGPNYGYHILGTGSDGSELAGNYDWAGIFKTVKKGEVLWSNYVDDFRSLEDVPQNEKVKLQYNAIYVHASEACGGGFIFWKDGKFNWLQQE